MYFQGIFAIILLCFPHADDLIKASFRNAVLTLYAIGIALPVTPDRHSSVEVRVVLHGFINILFISALAMMSFRSVIRTWRHIAVFIGTIPLEYWACTATASGVKHPQCQEFDSVSKVIMGSNTYPLYVVLWGTSVGTAVLALPALSLLWVPPVLRRLRRVVLAAAIFTWLVTWIFVIIASETSLKNYPYRYRLGFGQIMTLVMLFSQIWDIIYYPFGISEHGGRRIVYWWRAGFRPWYSKTSQKCNFPPSSQF